MPRWTIPVDAIPPQFTVWDWIVQHTDIAQAMRDVRPSVRARAAVIEVPAAIDLPALRRAYLACAAEVGELRGFSTANGQRTAYVGFSLTHNPQHIDGLDPFFSTLGTPRNKAGEFFALVRPAEQPQRKNSYWDAYGFNAVHPAIARHFALLLDRCTLSLIRSRAATIRHHEQALITAPEFNWHLDESPFCNLRVNIPLFTAEQYLMEIDSEYRHPSMPHRVAGRNLRWRGHLAAGRGYSWDTQLAHRVFANGAPTVDRVHLVLGFSPWFDWHAEQRVWQSNAHYGRVHPLDLAASGMVLGHRDAHPQPAPQGPEPSAALGSA